MFSLRFALSLTMTIGLIEVVALGQQPDRDADSTSTSTEQPTAPPSAPADMSVDEAIRAAIKAIDELQSADDKDTRSSLLADFNRFAKVVADSAPDNPWLQYLYGRAYAATGRQGDAIDLLRKFVETREGRNEWLAHRILGDLFIEGFPRLAIANYRKAAALNENEPTVLFGLSRCAARIGEYDDAVRDAEQTVAADGRRTILYLNHLASLLANGQQWARAASEAKAALTLAQEAAKDPAGKPPPLQLLDAQYKLLIDISGGQSAANPMAPQPYIDTARYLRARGDNAAKMNLWQILHVLELGMERTAPNTGPQLLQEYAKTLAQVGQRNEAVAEFEKLLAIEPSNPVAAEWLPRLRQVPVDDPSAP